MSVLINEAYANGTIPLWAKPGDALYTAGSGITIASNVISATSEAFGTIQTTLVNKNNNGIADTIQNTLGTMTIPSAYVGKLCVATITGFLGPPTMASGTTYGGLITLNYTDNASRTYNAGDYFGRSTIVATANYFFSISLPFVPTASPTTLSLIFTNFSGVTITTQAVTITGASLVMTENTTASGTLLA